MSGNENGPVNALTQLWLWKIEIDIIGKVLGCIGIGVIIIVITVFGVHNGTIVIRVVVGSLAIGCVDRIIFHIKNAIASPSQRSVDRAFARGSAMMHKAMGPNWRD